MGEERGLDRWDGAVNDQHHRYHWQGIFPKEGREAKLMHPIKCWKMLQGGLAYKGMEPTQVGAVVSAAATATATTAAVGPTRPRMGAHTKPYHTKYGGKNYVGGLCVSLPQRTFMRVPTAFLELGHETRVIRRAYTRQGALGLPLLLLQGRPPTMLLFILRRVQRLNSGSAS